MPHFISFPISPQSTLPYNAHQSSLLPRNLIKRRHIPQLVSQGQKSNRKLDFRSRNSSLLVEELLSKMVSYKEKQNMLSEEGF